MKVYAHYASPKTHPEIKNEYRWRTLLQFGTSWEVIGSIVMFNPGSAHPQDENKTIDDEEVLCHLRPFCSEYDWYAFTDDPTLRFVEGIFRAYYETHFDNPELNGIIQVFNLMNVCDTDENEAQRKFKEEVLPFSKTVDKDITKLIAPVYLGWGKSMNGHPCFREDREKLFQVVYNDMNGKYLHANFNENLFYHPRYMMGRGKNRSMSKNLFHAFCQNTENPSY